MRKLLMVLLLPFGLFAQDHLLISEVMIPSSTEQGKTFIEIYNPTNQPVDLSTTYLANYNTYFNMVNGDYSTNQSHFLVGFPAGQLAAKQNVVVALNASGFEQAFGQKADFEIGDSDATVPNMNVLFRGGAAKLESSAMLVLFRWDGQSDLVQDVDYIPWGLSFFSARWMNKSAVSVDGPDADSDASTYNNEAMTGSQDAQSTPTGGQSLQRNGVSETDEASSGGNGVNGHDETSESWTVSFRQAGPSPGSFSEVAGDGSGVVTVQPDTVAADTTIGLQFSVRGEEPYTIETLELVVPESWGWEQGSGVVALQGAAFSGASVSRSADTVLIENAQITAQQNGTIDLMNITTASVTEFSTFSVRSATSGGSLTPISEQPRVLVIAPLRIADIQNNFDEYDGQVVTLEAVISIGAGITTISWTDVYIQDASGRGINVYSADSLITGLERGNAIRITGTVDEFSGTTEIVDFTINEILSTGNDVPAVPRVSIAGANDISLEGTMVETAGIITDLYSAGGGTNITIDDGASSITARAWDTAGLDFSNYSMGDTVAIRGVIDQFQSAAQLLLAYQEDIFAGQIETAVDGSGRVTVTPRQVEPQDAVTATFAFTATAENPVTRVQLQVPGDWGWTSSSADVSGDGAFSSADITVDGNTINLENANLLPGVPGNLQVSSLTASQADTVSVFAVQTAGSGGALTPIAADPLITVGSGTSVEFISIAEARTRPIDSQVTIKATVVLGAGILRNDFTSAYVADETGAGLNVFAPGGLDPNIERGNVLLMTGTLEEFNGVLEITNYDATVLARNAPLPDPLELSTGEARLTEYEGSWVNIKGIITGLVSAGGGENVYIDDGSGETTVRAWNTTGVDLSDYAPGDLVQVTGSHGIFSNAGQILLGYDEDISKLDLDEVPITLDVPAKPFAPDLGEEFPISYSSGGGETNVTMRVYDLGGRLVTTIIDGPGIALETVKRWDGRNEFGELVPVGTYIIHFEVVNENNGKKTTKVAPVVVGTQLSR